MQRERKGCRRKEREIEKERERKRERERERERERTTVRDSKHVYDKAIKGDGRIRKRESF